MPVGNITGLSSGIDWGETVDLLMQIERQPVDALETRRKTFQSQLTYWNSVEGKIEALKTVTEGMDSASEFLIRSVTSSDVDVLTVDANDEAVSSSHEVEINQLATNHVLVHLDGWADDDTTVINDSGSNQSFSFQYADEVFTISVATGTTLHGLANLINSDEDNPGVTASILNDGGGGDGAYHLVLSGQDSGVTNLISIVNTVDNPTNLGDGSQFDTDGWETTKEPRNAEVRVDGFPDPDWDWPNPWIESESNEIEGILPGVTLNLKDTTEAGKPIKIEINTDEAAITEKVNELVTSYNALISEIDTLSSYDAEAEEAGPLFGDNLVRSIKTDLMNFVGENVPGTIEGDNFRSLGQVGLSLTSGGLLSLDTDRFEEALADNSTAVARLFVFDVESSSTYIEEVSHGTDTMGGQYDFTLTYDADGNLDTEATNTIAGTDVIIHSNKIFSGANDTDVQDLLLKFTNPGNGPNEVKGTIRVFTGLSALFNQKIEQYTDTDAGDLKYTRDRISDTVDLLDEKILNWETRLESIEKNYNREFSAMETLISQMNTQGSYIESAL